MRTRYQYICMGILSVALWSCAGDDTTTGGNPISTITIDENCIQEEYNLNKNDILTITPQISQTIAGKEINYEWEVEHETYSNEPELVYNCTKLGTFNCRLIVSNEDGKAFFPFVINVNTPYEEGVTIISTDPTGKSMLSFMLHNIDGSEDSFYQGDMFTLNNPEMNFASNVSDMMVTNGSLVISCKGNGSSSEPGTIYYLNGKTFDIENFIEVPEYPDFQPIKMLVPSSVGMGGASYPVLSANGEIFGLASTEGTVTPLPKYDSTYNTLAYATGKSSTGMAYPFLVWDENLGVPILMDSNSIFYFISDYTEAKRLPEKGVVNATNNIFATNKDEIVAFFIPEWTTKDLVLKGTSRDPEIYVITKSNGQLRRSKFGNSVWAGSYPNYYFDCDQSQLFYTIGNDGDAGFTAGVPMVVSNTNKMAFYGSGNKLYMWPYEQNTLAYSTVLTEIGNPSSVITSIELSTDQKTLYIASYDPTQAGLNGSCHLVTVNKNTATDDVTVGGITNYNNVSYKPVKIMYKNK